jgi:hypothetical protein
MNSNTETPANKEFKYLRFLNETLQAQVLRQEICDEFSRKVFDYLKSEPHFDAHIFCAFLYKFINKCKLYRPVVMRSANPIDRMRLAYIPEELLLFLDLPSIKFALSSINANLFYGIPLEEKLKHLLHNDEPTWKKARVEIKLPEVSGNAGFISYVDIEFTLPHLTIEQKLDIIHFTICALNYLSQNAELVETFSNPAISSSVYISTPEHFKVISDILHQIRNTIIGKVVSEKAELDEDSEFDENLSDVARILVAQNQDPKIEKQWLDENSPVFVKAEIEATVERAMKTKGYPPHYLQQIIDTAVRLYEQNDRVRAIDIYNELRIEKNTYNSRIKFFGYDTAMILEAARNKVRESEVRKKVVKSIKR